MGIDLRENGNGFNDLREHIGHRVVVVGYGCKEGPIVGETQPVNVAIECLNCGVVLVDFDQPVEKELTAEEEITVREIALMALDVCSEEMLEALDISDEYKKELSQKLYNIMNQE